MNRKLLLQLIAIFVITQVLGLYVANYLITIDVSAQFVTEDPEDVVNSVFLFGYIIIFTAVLLVIIKLAKGRLLYYILKAFELLAIFFTAIIVFSAFYDSLLIIIPAILIVLLRILLAKNIWLRNVTSVIATVGAGTIIGVSLGIMPVIVFLVLLSVYDYIAVFKTKHMVTLAKAVTKKNLSFTYALPTKEHTFELGTGDIVMPLMFSASVLKFYYVKYVFPVNFLPSLVILIAALLALLWTLNYSSKHVGKPLPALPPQTIAMIFAATVLFLGGI